MATSLCEFSGWKGEMQRHETGRRELRRRGRRGMLRQTAHNQIWTDIPSLDRKSASTTPGNTIYLQNRDEHFGIIIRPIFKSKFTL